MECVGEEGEAGWPFQSSSRRCVCVCVQITKCGRIKTLLLLVHLRASQLFNTPPLRTPV